MFDFVSRTGHKVFKKIFGGYFDEAGFITYVNNIQWFTVAKFFGLIVSLVTTVIVARIFGPETFGTLNYVTSIVGMFAIIANLGIGNVVYKELILRKERRAELLGSALYLNFITGLIAIAVLSVFLFFVNEIREIKVLILLLSLSFLTQPFTHLSFDFLKDREGKYVTIAQVATSFISSTLKIASVYYFASLIIFISILVLENLIAGTIYLYQMARIKKRSISFVVNKEELALLLSLGVPLAFFSVFSEIYARIDQIMLRHYLDIKAVGLYAAGVRLTELWYMVPNIILGALFPALANTKHDPKEYKRRFDYLLFMLGTLSVVISFVVFFTRDTIIRLVYGEDFIAASPLLGVYIFSLVGFFISLLIYQDLLLANRKWLLLLLPFATAVINVGLNIWLIPIKGALGAALATVVSYNIVPPIFLLLSRKHNQPQQ